MLMQLRDEGRLTLDDLLADHLPDVGHPVTVRQALAHVSGMQREPLGDVWDTLEQPDAASLVRGFAEAERVGRPHTRWHYSNLAYAVLGQVVEKLDGRPWVESLDERLLRPLEMRRTTVGFVDDDHVTGYFVPPFHDVPREEPVLDLRAMTPVGGLASTARDLARWSAFVASPPTRSSPPTPWRRCASRRSCSTPSDGTAGWAWACSSSARPRGARGSATTAGCPVTSPRCSRTARAGPEASC